jgi:hypothetical protein
MLALRGAALAVLLVGSVPTAANAAYIRSATSSEGKEVVFLDGEIEPGDAQSLRNVIKRSNDASRLVSAIRLNSPGGNLAEGAKLADIIRYGKIPTVVPAGAQCASACFLLFAAGSEKYASYSANVGVHGASDQSGREEGDATVSMARMAKPNLGAKLLCSPSKGFRQMHVSLLPLATGSPSPVSLWQDLARRAETV